MKTCQFYHFYIHIPYIMKIIIMNIKHRVITGEINHFFLRVLKVIYLHLFYFSQYICIVHDVS